MATKGISGVRVLGYLAYALLLSGVLLYVRFPAEKFETYLVRKVEAAFPEAGVELGKYQYSFPTTIHLDRAVFSSQKGGEEIVLLEDIDITPVLTGMGLEYSLAGQMYMGSFRGILKLAPVDKRFTLDDIALTGVEFGRSVFLKDISRREISGLLDYKGMYAGSLQGDGQSVAKGVLSLGQGGFTLLQPVLTLRKLDMQSLEVGVSFVDGVLELVEGTFKGAEMHGEFNGSLTIADRMEAWKVQLSGNLVPQKSFMKDKPQVLRVVKRLQKQYRTSALPYMVSGSIGNPRFRFGTN